LVVPIMTLPIFDWNKDLPIINTAQLAFSEKLFLYLTALKYIDANLKNIKDVLSEICTEADKNLKMKSDKIWVDLELNNLAKTLDGLQQNWKAVIEQIDYWHNNIHWLQSRFPKAQYNDIIGLCKIANKNEYAEEQEYSLNAGRYVGVEIEDDNTSAEDFKLKIIAKNLELEKLVGISNDIELQIKNNIKSLFYD